MYRAYALRGLPQHGIVENLVRHELGDAAARRRRRSGSWPSRT